MLYFASSSLSVLNYKTNFVTNLNPLDSDNKCVGLCLVVHSGSLSCSLQFHKLHKISTL